MLSVHHKKAARIAETELGEANKAQVAMRQSPVSEAARSENALDTDDLEAGKVAKDLQDQVNSIGNDKEFDLKGLPGLNPMVHTPIPQLQKNEHEAEQVISDLSDKVDSFDVTSDAVDNDGRQEKKAQLSSEHDKLADKVFRKLNMRKARKAKTVADRTAMSNRLAKQPAASEEELIKQNTNELKEKVRVTEMKAETAKLEQENKVAKERLEDNTQAEALLGKVESLENVMGTMQKSLQMDSRDEHMASMQARIDHLDRRLRRVAEKKADEATASPGSDGLNALTSTLTAAIKLASGQNEEAAGGSKLVMPDELKELQLEQKKQILIKKKEQLQDELFDLRQKHELMKLSVKAEKGAIRDEGKMMLEAKEGKMHHQVEMQKRAMKMAAEKELATIQTAMAKDKTATADSEATQDDAIDRAQLEYDKLQAELGVLDKTNAENDKMITTATEEASNQKAEEQAEIRKEEDNAAKLESAIEDEKDAVSNAKIDAQKAEAAEATAAAAAGALEDTVDKQSRELKGMKDSERSALQAKESNEQTIAKEAGKLALMKKDEDTRAKEDAEAVKLAKLISQVKGKIMGDQGTLNTEKAKEATRQTQMRAQIEQAKNEKDQAKEKASEKGDDIQNTISQMQDKEDDAVAASMADIDSQIAALKGKVATTKAQYHVELEAAREEAETAKASADQAVQAAELRKQAAEDRAAAAGEKAMENMSAEQRAQHEAETVEVVHAKKKAHEIVQQAIRVLQDSKQKAAEKVSLAKAKATEAVNAANQECLLTQNEAEADFTRRLHESSLDRAAKERQLAAEKERTARLVQASMDAAEKAANSEILVIRDQTEMEEEKMASAGTNSTSDEEDETSTAMDAALDEKKLAQGEWYNMTLVVQQLKAMTIKYTEMASAATINQQAIQAKLEEVEAETVQKKDEYDKQISIADAAQAAADEIEERADDAEGKREDLEKDLNKASSDKMLAAEKVARVQEEKQDLESKINHLQNTLDELESEKITLNVEATAFHHNSTTSRVEVQQAKLEVTEAQKEYAATKAEYKLAEAQQTAAEEHAAAVQEEAATAQGAMGVAA